MIRGAKLRKTTLGSLRPSVEFAAPFPAPAISCPAQPADLLGKITSMNPLLLTLCHPPNDPPLNRTSVECVPFPFMPWAQGAVFSSAAPTMIRH